MMMLLFGYRHSRECCSRPRPMLVSSFMVASSKRMGQVESVTFCPSILSPFIQVQAFYQMQKHEPENLGKTKLIAEAEKSTMYTIKRYS